MNGKTRLAMAARTAFINAERLGVSKSQGHPDMARRKSQPQVKPQGIDAGVMREQLDQRRARRMGVEIAATMFPHQISTHRGQPERLFGLADPAPHGGISVEMKAALMRQPCIGQ
jgi:hypothetical protein